MHTPSSLLSLLALTPLALAQSCPPVHVFGARETTASPGYGTAGSVVQAILNANSGATAEAINYPASGSNPTYAQSVAAGTSAVCSQVSSFAAKCPNTKLVVVGYSQGAEIFDNALCGGGDPNQGLSSTCSIANYNIAAAIFMGDPRFRAGAPYNVGTCAAYGFSARPAGQYCGSYNSKVKSYCDSTDPYCCTGNDANSHQQYANKYGQQALSFVQSQLASGGNTGGGSTITTTTRPTTTPTTTTTPPTTTTGGGGGGGSCGALFAQCGGQGWQGPTCCSQGTCKNFGQYYSQCLN